MTTMEQFPEHVVVWRFAGTGGEEEHGIVVLHTIKSVLSQNLLAEEETVLAWAIEAQANDPRPSTTIEPDASETGRPAPMAAAMGSSIR